MTDTVKCRESRRAEGHKLGCGQRPKGSADNRGVDEILASGRYVDTRGRAWEYITVAGLWLHWPAHRRRTSRQMRRFIRADQHRDECPGMYSCADHPVPMVWASRITGMRSVIPARESGLLPAIYDTISAAMDAAYKLAKESN